MSQVESILEEKGLEYETEKKQTIFGNKYKEIYLPRFDVSILKVKKKAIVKPDNRKVKDNVYEIIDLKSDEKLNNLF